MEQRGLVERAKSTEEGRGILIRLTGLGQDTLRRSAPGHAAWVRSHFIDLASAEELDAIVALSQRVIVKSNQAG